MSTPIHWSLGLGLALGIAAAQAAPGQTGLGWIQRLPGAAPSARLGHAMALDSTSCQPILFGGFDGGSRLNDTWEWTGRSWTKRSPSASPDVRHCHALAADSLRRRTVCFGGYAGSLVSGLFNDTWEWDRYAWTLVPAGLKPAARRGHAAAYDPFQARLVLFGGVAAGWLADTWELVSCPPSFTALGQGCQGSHGKAPVLSGLEPPSLGLTFHLGMSAAPPLAPSFIFFDITDPAVDLTPFGATGCWARVNPGFISLYLPVSLTGTWHPAPILSVPYQTALLGAAFYVQAFLLDAGANPLGLITSNGLKAVVGF